MSATQETLYKQNTDLMTRNALAEEMAQQTNPHPTLTFNLTPDPTTTNTATASVLVAFITRADLTTSASAPNTLFPPLLPVAHLFPSPPHFPQAARDDLLKRTAGATHSLYVEFSTPNSVQQVLLVLLGETTAAPTDDDYRNATYQAIVELKAKRVEHAAVLLPNEHVLQRLDVIVRIAVLSNHYFSKYLTQQQVHVVSTLTLINTSLLPAAELQQVVHVASTITEGTVFARTLAIDRADTITPSYMQHICQLVADTSNLKMTVIGQDELRQQGLYLLASVGQGAREGEKARLIVLEYKGDESTDKVVALCGKGICFDAGGLHLKQTGDIENMHLDCSGAAVALATIKSLAALNTKVNLVVALSLAENMIGPHAQKPLTVWPTVRGTVEVSNTDCEGRLALVDAFTYCQRHHNVHTLLDCATLTLSVWMICGDVMSAAFSNDDTLYSHFNQAGNAVSERLWRFPVWPEHTAQLKNTEGYSDWKNFVGKVGESCTAAAFLQLYVDEGVRWLHVDFGGVSMTTKRTKWLPQGGTGFGVQLFCEYIMKHVASDGEGSKA